MHEEVVTAAVQQNGREYRLATKVKELQGELHKMGRRKWNKGHYSICSKCGEDLSDSDSD